MLLLYEFHVVKHLPLDYLPCNTTFIRWNAIAWLELILVISIQIWSLAAGLDYSIFIWLMNTLCWNRRQNERYQRNLLIEK